MLPRSLLSLYSRALLNSGESFWAASRAQRKRGCIAAASRPPALQLLLGQGLEKRFIHADLQEPQLAAGAGIERQEQGGEVRLRLLDVDAARRRPLRAGGGWSDPNGSAATETAH